MNRVEFWSAVDRRLRIGQNVFAALVVRHTLHSPGTTGARLLISEDGNVEGTIGGGVMEFEVVKRGRRTVVGSDPVAEIHHLYHREDAPGETSGMICAGEQINLYYLFRPDADGAAVAKIAQASHSDRQGVATFRGTGISFENEGEIATGRQFHLANPESKDWEFREQIMNLKRVAVFGGGHCGLALSRALHHLGYDVFLFETRSDVHTFSDNAFARSKTVVPDYSVAAEMLHHAASTDAVVMTTDYPSDIAALTGLASAGQFRSVGLMGSPAKITRVKRELRSRGVSGDFIESLRAPVGLPIHSNTPEEIALSVAGQIVQSRNVEEMDRR